MIVSKEYELKKIGRRLRDGDASIETVICDNDRRYYAITDYADEAVYHVELHLRPTWQKYTTGGTK